MSVLTSSPRRVTVVAPHTRADVALPLEASVAEVVQQLVALVLVDVDDPPAASDGWLLSRLGREPLDGEQLVAAAGLRDGEVLYLTPSSARLPPVVFDDVVDALAEGARTNRWTPASTVRAALVAAAAVTLAGLGALLTAGPPWSTPAAVAAGTAALLLISAAGTARALGEPRLATAVAAAAVTLAGLAALLTAGPPWSTPAAVAAGTAALLLVSAAGTARALGEPRLATAVAVAAAGFAGVAGVLALAGDRDLPRVGPAALLVGSAALLCACVLGALAVGRPAPVFVATALLALTGALCCGWAGWSGTPAPRIAAAAAAVLLLGQPLLPVAALRLARLPFPRLPADPAEFRRARSAALDDGVLARAAQADDALTALVAAVDLALLVATTVLLFAPDRWARVLALAVAVVVVVRARHAQVRLQRAVMLLTGATTLLVAAAHAVATASPAAHAAAAPAAVGLAALAVAYARKAPGRSPSAYGWRLLDVVEFVATAAVIPLVLAVFDLYATVRGLAG